MKYLKFKAALLMLIVSPVAYSANCSFPDEIQFPVHKSVTEKELLGLQDEINQYIEALVVVRDCLLEQSAQDNMEQGTDDEIIKQKSEDINTLIELSYDRENTAVKRYNAFFK